MRPGGAMCIHLNILFLLLVLATCSLLLEFFFCRPQIATTQPPINANSRRVSRDAPRTFAYRVPHNAPRQAPRTVSHFLLYVKLYVNLSYMLTSWYKLALLCLIKLHNHKDSIVCTCLAF